MRLIVSLGLSDFIDRDEEKCKDRLRQSMRLLHDFTPRAQWFLEYCEDCAIEADISEESFEKFKADENSQPEGDEDWLYQRHLGDGFWVSATITNESPYGRQRIEIGDKTMKGVLTTVAKTGWLGEIARIIAL